MKKGFYVLEQSLDLAVLDSGRVDNWDKTQILQKYLLPQMQPAKICNSGDISGCFAAKVEGMSETPDSAVILLDGISIASKGTDFWIDINNTQPPNIMGADVFQFRLEKYTEGGEKTNPHLTFIKNIIDEITPKAYAEISPNETAVELVVHPYTMLRSGKPCPNGATGAREGNIKCTIKKNEKGQIISAACHGTEPNDLPPVKFIMEYDKYEGLFTSYVNITFDAPTIDGAPYPTHDWGQNGQELYNKLCNYTSQTFCYARMTEFTHFDRKYAVNQAPMSIPLENYPAKYLPFKNKFGQYYMPIEYEKDNQINLMSLIFDGHPTRTWFDLYKSDVCMMIDEENAPIINGGDKGETPAPPNPSDSSGSNQGNEENKPPVIDDTNETTTPPVIDKEEKPAPPVIPTPPESEDKPTVEPPNEENQPEIKPDPQPTPDVPNNWTPSRPQQGDWHFVPVGKALRVIQDGWKIKY